MLSIHDLCFAYPGYPGLPARTLFQHLDLEVAPGSCVRILGQPDSGKTTLARMIAGLVPRHTGGQVEGRIAVCGKDVGTTAPGDLLESVGLVFQNPDEQILTARVETEIAFGLESLGVSPKSMQDAVQIAMHWAGIEGLARRDPLSLSGGEKRRLLLACLYAIHPAVWVLDECLDELDPRYRARLLSQLRDDRATVLLLASKEMRPEAGDVDATYLLEDGRVGRGRGARAHPARQRGAGPRAGTQELLIADGLEFRFASADSFRLDVPRFTLHQAEVVALTGPNGAGKTTLGRLLCGLLTPRSGAVRLRTEGHMVPADAAALRTSVAYVYQNPDYQLFLPTVRDELAYGLLEHGASKDQISRGVSDAVEAFNLPAPDAPVALLSYGTRKRLQMAVYWLIGRTVIILDEADVGLTRVQFYSALDRFRSRDTALVIISHDEQIAAAAADRVVHMEGGVI